MAEGRCWFSFLLMMKEPPWGVKSAYGRVTPPVGSLNPINCEISRDSVKFDLGRRWDGGDLRFALCPRWGMGVSKSA